MILNLNINCIIFNINEKFYLWKNYLINKMSNKIGYHQETKDNYYTIKDNSQRMTSMTMNTTNVSRSSGYNKKLPKQNKKEEAIRLSRYRLNQYYLHKFNEDKMKMQKTNNLSYLNHYSQSSFLTEKMVNTSRSPSTENIIETKYDFNRNLYDDQYHERLRFFNEKRHKGLNGIGYNNVRTITNSWYNNNKQIYQPQQQQENQFDQYQLSSYNDCNYSRSNLSTNVPMRRIRLNDYFQ